MKTVSNGIDTEQVAEFNRQLNKTKIRFGALGLAVGAAASALITYKLVHLRADAKYRKIADDEIAEMREHYQAKARAAEGVAQKGAAESLAKSQGYSSPNEGPPMAVQPPESVVVEEEDDDEEEPHINTVEELNTVTPNTLGPVTTVDEKHGYKDTWDYQEELRKRSPEIPYIIHVDEIYEMDDYDQVTLIYYEDDVLVNERDEIIDPGLLRDRMIGEKHLNQFGHGAGERDLLYIRNDKLEIVFEIQKSGQTFAHEVHGFRHENWDRGNIERMRARERDAPEE